MHSQDSQNIFFKNHLDVPFTSGIDYCISSNDDFYFERDKYKNPLVPSKQEQEMFAKTEKLDQLFSQYASAAEEHISATCKANIKLKKEDIKDFENKLQLERSKLIGFAKINPIFKSRVNETLIYYEEKGMT